MASLRSAGIQHDEIEELVSEIFHDRPGMLSPHHVDTNKLDKQASSVDSPGGKRGTSIVALLESHLAIAQKTLAAQHRIMEAQMAAQQRTLASQHQQTVRFVEQRFVEQFCSNSGPAMMQHMSQQLKSQQNSGGTGETVETGRPPSNTPESAPWEPNLLVSPQLDSSLPPSRIVSAAGSDRPQHKVQYQSEVQSDGCEPAMSDHTDLFEKKHSKHRQSIKIGQMLAKAEAEDIEHPEMIAASKRDLLAHAPANLAVFVDENKMKNDVKDALMKPEYDVTNFYYDTGYCQALARNGIFDSLTTGVVAMNAIWIAIDTDLNHSPTLMEAHPVFQAGENFFCVYFTAEVVIRFLSFKQKRKAFTDAWFFFDFSLVTMMVLETWVMNLMVWAMGSGGDGLGNTSILRLVRLLRLTRMARMVRLLRALPELMILVKGISVAMRSVFFTLCLLLLVIFVFAIVFTMLAVDTDLAIKYFGSVPHSMSSLLLHGVLPDLAILVDDLADEHWSYAIIVMIFIFVSTLTVMNMLVGVLCEVVSVVSSVEKEHMSVLFVKMQLLQLLELSGNYDGEATNQAEINITQADFELLISMPEGAKILHEVGVDVVGLNDFADHIFQDSERLRFSDFMEVILGLRGSNSATVRDLVDLRKFVANEIQESITDATDKLEKSIFRAAGKTATCGVSRASAG